MSKSINTLIVGGGKSAAALIKIAAKSETVTIIGVVDSDKNSVGIKLAEKLKIDTADNWDDLIKVENLNEVIDVTDNDETHKKLLNDTPKNVILISGVASRALNNVATEFENIDKQLQEAKEDVEAAEWAVKKTNEGIKKLYIELEKKNEELKKFDQLKSDFLATVSHELRTPLAITKEGISLILDGALGHVSEKQTKVLTTAASSIDRLSRLINNLLDVSKIESGKEEVKISLVSLTQIAHQVVSFFESKVSAKGLEVRANVPSTDIEAYADSDKVVQIFTNIINNAIKFTDEGYIEIGLEEKDNEIECSIQDTGKGVPEDEIANMFVKFQQIDRVHGDGEKGTGLGLNIVQGIVELHKGKIWAESEVGKGTKVIFTLPKRDERIILKEYVEKGMAVAEENDNKMSLIVVGVNESSSGGESFSDQKICSVLKDVDGILKTSLDHSGGTALKEARECIVILPNSSKENALSAEGRLKQAIDDYLKREQLTNQISLRFGCATYPDEASSGDELIDLALKNNS